MSFLDSIDPSTFDTSSLDFSNIDLPSVAPDLSSLFMSASGAPLVQPPLNLALPTQSITGAATDVLGNITKLVTGVYQGEAAITAAQSARDIANARAQNALVTVKTTPNVWMVLGLGAAAIFALELVGRSK